MMRLRMVSRVGVIASIEGENHLDEITYAVPDCNSRDEIFDRFLVLNPKNLSYFGICTIDN